MKRKGLIIGAVILLLVLIVYSSISGKYNQMVSKDEVVKGKWASVETQYQRRMDLIPNLVRTVEGYAQFEKSTLTAVVEARAKATSITVDPSKLSPAQIQQFQSSQDQLGSALGRLLVTIEKYPELKANQNFSELQAQLEGTENRISVSRNDFNAAVQDYNFTIRTFPANTLAPMFGFQEKGYFQATAGAEKAPSVQFNLK